VFVLGNRFSGLVAIQRGHTLVTTGPFRFVRNPSYLGLIIASAGWALAFRSAVGVLLTVVMLPALVARMHSEERLLGAHFGAKYEAYRARTWRLLPWIY
jgi:protein-S-isoprenylcysteine O-methyltransferase Ste14